ncbi:hypothetical protein EPA93_11245 [Ktedonosporobacter rubrisoli]|uniref:Uncharacterized protein n=1 Tax=Ktedonosporobacter rubrisoli TaxID=2509675 RepID=A0A4P6JMR9_KTERU|nr:hypothetical protein EPA93_11245 [Ktedonosporobacter rubrisoli]
MSSLLLLGILLSGLPQARLPAWMSARFWSVLAALSVLLLWQSLLACVGLFVALSPARLLPAAGWRGPWRFSLPPVPPGFLWALGALLALESAAAGNVAASILLSGRRGGDLAAGARGGRSVAVLLSHLSTGSVPGAPAAAPPLFLRHRCPSQAVQWADLAGCAQSWWSRDDEPATGRNAGGRQEENAHTDTMWKTLPLAVEFSTAQRSCAGCLDSSSLLPWI